MSLMQKSWKTKYSKKEKKIVYFMQFYSLSYTNIKPWCKAMNLAHSWYVYHLFWFHFLATFTPLLMAEIFFFSFFAHLNVKFSWICIQKILGTYFMPIIGIFCYFSDFWQFLAKLGCPRPYPPLSPPVPPPKFQKVSWIPPKTFFEPLDPL